MHTRGFLEKIIDFLKHMEVDDRKGGKKVVVNATLLPSSFWVKVYHPTYETWKDWSALRRINSIATYAKLQKVLLLEQKELMIRIKLV